MGEVLIDQLEASQGVEQSTPLVHMSYSERLRAGLGQVTEGGMSLLDVTAGIALARDDMRLTRRAMNALDEPYDGLIGRQANADHISPQLESDILSARGGRQAGYTDVDSMPPELRADVAVTIVDQHRGKLAADMATLHPEWSSEELDAAVQTRAADMVTLLQMGAEEREAYLAAQREYHELQTAIPEIETELNNLRTERNDRLSRIGRAALSGIIGFAGRVRNAPSALSARVVVTGMSVTDRLRNMNPENRRKVFWGTAAGIALAGVASYVAMRAGRSSGSGGNYVLASSDNPLIPDHVGSAAQTPLDHVGTTAVPTDNVGTFAMPTDHLGTSTSMPQADIFTPAHHVGTANTVPTDHIGSSQGIPTDHVGSTFDTPTHVGGSGESLATAQSSSELFGKSTRVTNWPDTIRVSKWNAQNLDGSLTGISRQMLIRSGVEHPGSDQVQALVDVLRPQAQPNGYLLQDQVLDLRPATQVLRSLLQK